MIRTGMILHQVVLLCIFLLTQIEKTDAHGYLADPPARSSAWLFDDDFKACCEYFNHNEMFCGGTHRQWTLNKGKCSICGEPNDEKFPAFSRGGKMYLGKIVRTYRKDTTIPVRVMLTANHMGYFEFRLCNLDKTPDQDATEDCLNLNLLRVTNHSTRFTVQPDFDVFHLNVSLPKNLTCQHCVFQWKYVTGNSWGNHLGKECLGCGEENEEFYGCSDVSIVEEEISSIVDTTPRLCKSSMKSSFSSDSMNLMEQYCQAVCKSDCRSEKKQTDEQLYQRCFHRCHELCICE